jgi:ribosomal protein L7/L12
MAKISKHKAAKTFSYYIALAIERSGTKVSDDMRAELTDAADAFNEEPILVSNKYPARRDAIELVSFLAADKKIEAIRAYRALTGSGLLESKNAIEGVTSRLKKSKVA